MSVIMSTCNGYKESDEHIVSATFAMRDAMHPLAVENQSRKLKQYRTAL